MPRRGSVPTGRRRGCPYPLPEKRPPPNPTRSSGSSSHRSLVTSHEAPPRRTRPRSPTPPHRGQRQFTTPSQLPSVTQNGLSIYGRQALESDETREPQCRMRFSRFPEPTSISALPEIVSLRADLAHVEARFRPVSQPEAPCASQPRKPRLLASRSGVASQHECRSRPAWRPLVNEAPLHHIGGCDSESRNGVV